MWPVQDLASIVRQVAEFLGKEVDESQVAWLVHHCSFGQMSVNPATNNEAFGTAPTELAKGIKFMRKGEVRCICIYQPSHRYSFYYAIFSRKRIG